MDLLAGLARLLADHRGGQVLPWYREDLLALDVAGRLAFLVATALAATAHPAHTAHAAAHRAATGRARAAATSGLRAARHGAGHACRGLSAGARDGATHSTAHRDVTGTATAG